MKSLMLSEIKMGSYTNQSYFLSGTMNIPIILKDWR
jgi:hypothetical protein